MTLSDLRTEAKVGRTAGISSQHSAIMSLHCWEHMVAGTAGRKGGSSTVITLLTITAVNKKVVIKYSKVK